MNVFELLFIVVFFSTVGTLVAALVLALCGRVSRSLRALGVLGVVLVLYLGVVVIVSLISPRCVIPVGEAQCFDDWCVSVDRVERSALDDSVAFDVTLCLSSRARRRVQREAGVSVYAVDGSGRRYEAETDPQAIGLAVALAPGESVLTSRRFVLPAGATGPGLVVTHGWFPGAFIIGDDQSLLHKPAIVPLEP